MVVYLCLQHGGRDAACRARVHVSFVGFVIFPVKVKAGRVNNNVISMLSAAVHISATVAGGAPVCTSMSHNFDCTL